MLYGDNNVIVQGIVMWDGITKPEPLKGENGKPDGLKFSCKIAIPNGAPEIAELDQVLRTELTNGQFRGALPNGALWGISDINPTELEGRLPAHKCINAVSYHQVQVFDASGKELPNVAYAQAIYPGAVVRLVVSARTYNNKSKGLGFWLGGIQVIDSTTPRLPVGSGVNAAAAFGAAPPVGGPVGGPPAAAAPPVGYPTAVYQPPSAQVPPAGPAVGGYAPAPAAAPPAAYQPPPAPAPAYQPPPAPGPGPAPDFLNPGTAAPAPPAGPQMTALATTTYQAYIAAGWTDDQLRAQGLMV